MSEDSRGPLDARTLTGIEGLDYLLDGGLPANRLYLIEGDPGTGKTTLALQFLLEGARAARRASTSPSRRRASELATVADVARLVARRASSVVELDGPKHAGPRRISTRSSIPPRSSSARRPRPSSTRSSGSTRRGVVFDSLSEMRLLARRSRCAIAARSSPSSSSSPAATARSCCSTTARPTADDLQLQSIAHGVVLLEQLPSEYGAARRRLRIVKVRGRAASTEGYHDFMIQRGGLDVSRGSSPPSTRAAVSRGAGLERRPGSTRSSAAGSTGHEHLFIGPAGSGKSTLAAQYATRPRPAASRRPVPVRRAAARPSSSALRGARHRLRQHLDAGPHRRSSRSTRRAVARRVRPPRPRRASRSDGAPRRRHRQPQRLPERHARGAVPRRAAARAAQPTCQQGVATSWSSPSTAARHDAGAGRRQLPRRHGHPAALLRGRGRGPPGDLGRQEAQRQRTSGRSAS